MAFADIRLVPLLALAFAGCTMSHQIAADSGTDSDSFGLDGSSDPATQLCECCGETVEWPRAISCDLGACDGSCLRPRDCVAAEAEVLEVSIRNDGSPWRIAVGGVDACHCGESVRCVGRVVGERVVSLDVELCDEGLDCDGCERFRQGECEMPPMDEGMWRVVQGGVDAFGPVQVADAEASIELGPPIWQTRTRGSEPYESMLWPPSQDAMGERVCVYDDRDEFVRVEVIACGSCAHGVVGSCSVALDGDVVRVDTVAQAPVVVDGIECPSPCVAVPRNCYFPRERDSFELEVDGVTRGRVDAVVDEDLCF